MKKLTLITLGCLFSVAANASKVCDEYFTEIDEMVKVAEQEAKGDADATAQITAMKQQLETAKTQIKSVPEETQDMACQQGLDALKEFKASMAKQ
ncbi:DUF5339 domain-containing protein [Morganella sp. GD04133]|uniref:DUF5339 domain-containing protein n=1 Tax=Morganella sp. GD04133 TaxID=2975435 RepID=UPI00244C9A63|nr:DUF5339 domain-containing protein [Morganella sp. GD04133]MDH0355499.1 DUF5339 domain-containing protein [Morganella sp. GD04133]